MYKVWLWYSKHIKSYFSGRTKFWTHGRTDGRTTLKQYPTAFGKQDFQGNVCQKRWLLQLKQLYLSCVTLTKKKRKNVFKCTKFVYIVYSCSYDYLELFDGESLSSPSLGRFCSDAFHSIISSQRYLTLQLITDDDKQEAGFKLVFNFVQARGKLKHLAAHLCYASAKPKKLTGLYILNRFQRSCCLLFMPISWGCGFQGW